ncbi:MAG: carbohydrate-binding protein, partial [Actinomycetota bacterium]
DGEVLAEITVAEVDLPSWQPSQTYTDGERVEHEGSIYEARWWSVATEPQLRPNDPYAHPWHHVGTIDGSESTSVGPPRWTPSAVYDRGVEVVHRGQLFRARWWNTDVEPDPFPELIFDHPWEFVGDE